MSLSLLHSIQGQIIRKTMFIVFILSGRFTHNGDNGTI